MQITTMRPSAAYVLPKKFLTLAALGSVLALTGCAGDPPKTQLAVTNQAITAAESAGAVEFAPIEMQNARNKLTEAQKAENDKKYEDAKRLAEQAEWDARVAERRAHAAKAQRALEDAQKGVQQLRQEGLRHIR